jgi:hypothetical protein
LTEGSAPRAGKGWEAVPLPFEGSHTEPRISCRVRPRSASPGGRSQCAACAVLRRLVLRFRFPPSTLGEQPGRSQAAPPPSVFSQAAPQALARSRTRRM